jgi:hypothetical protein
LCCGRFHLIPFLGSSLHRGSTEPVSSGHIVWLPLTDFIFYWPCISVQFLLITNLTHFFNVFIYLPLYVFRAAQCSSSGDWIVLIHHLVCISLCKWLLGMLVRRELFLSTCFVIPDGCIVLIQFCFDVPDQALTQTNTYQMMY